jgi:hypothetical protein
MAEVVSARNSIAIRVFQSVQPPVRNGMKKKSAAGIEQPLQTTSGSLKKSKKKHVARMV